MCPHRRLNTPTSCPSLAAVVDRQRIPVLRFCHSAKMSKLSASQSRSWLETGRAHGHVTCIPNVICRIPLWPGAVPWPEPVTV